MANVTSSSTISWTVDGVTNGNSTVGTITGTGASVTYTAPTTGSSHTVVCTSTTNGSINSSSTVSIVVAQTVAISLSPATFSANGGTTTALNASITGTTNTGVTWAVDGVTNGNSTVGTIIGSGTSVNYSAPNTTGTHTITATTAATPVKVATSTANVTAIPSVTVSLSPKTASGNQSTTTTVTATVTGDPTNSLTWTVNGNVGGNSTVGTLIINGLQATYTPPANSGSYTIAATSTVNSSASDSCVVTVSAATVSLNSANFVCNVSATKSLTATVVGVGDTSVTWSVDTITNGNTTVGTITNIVGNTVTYTAPATGGTHTIKATSVAVPGKSASITAKAVALPIASSISANTPTPLFGATVTLDPIFSNGVGIIGTSAGSSNVTTSATSGVLATSAAIKVPTQFFLTVTNEAGTTALATCSLAPQTVSVGAISPASPSRATGSATAFSAAVTGGRYGTVTWTASAGTITSAGLWTAPATTAGSPVTITATSVDDLTKSSSTTVTLTAALVAPSGLSYAQPIIYATQNVAITSDVPTVTGNVTSYTATLPAGMTIHPTTGVISGTPSVVTSPNLKQAVYSNNSYSQTEVSVVAGDLIIVGFSVGNTAATTTCADSAGNNYAQIGTNSYTANAGVCLSAFYAIAKSSSTLTITVATSNNDVPNIFVNVVSGMSATFASILDKFAFGSETAAGTSHTSASITTTYPNEFVYTLWGQDYTHSNFTAGTSGYNYRQQGTPLEFAATFDKNVSVTGAISQTISTTVATICGSLIASFKAAVNPTYTVTASNNSGSTTANVVIAVAAPVVAITAPTGLSYSSSTISATQNSAITNITPTVTGTVTSYTVAPSLPTGLQINAASGVISGTPTVTHTSSTYTVSANNSAGSATATITIAVAAAPGVAPSGLSYSPATISGTVSSAITQSTPTVTGTVTTYSISPALPTGITINSSTGIISGTPSATHTSSVFTVTATNATGFTTATVTVSIVAAGSNPTGFMALSTAFPTPEEYASSRTAAACTANAWMAGCRYGMSNQDITQSSAPSNTWASEATAFSGYTRPTQIKLVATRLTGDPDNSWGIADPNCLAYMDTAMAGFVAEANAAGATAFNLDLENYSTSVLMCNQGNETTQRAWGAAVGHSLWSRMPNAILNTFFGPTQNMQFTGPATAGNPASGVPTIGDLSGDSQYGYRYLAYFFLGLVDSLATLQNTTGRIVDYMEQGSYYWFAGELSLQRIMYASKHWVDIYFPGETAARAQAAISWVPVPMIYLNMFSEANFGTFYPGSSFLTDTTMLQHYFTRNCVAALKKCPSGHMPAIYFEGYDPWGTSSVHNLESSWANGLNNAIAVYNGTTTLASLFDVAALDSALHTAFASNSIWQAECGTII